MTDRRYPFLVPWRRASLPAEHEKYARDTFPDVERITGCSVVIDHRVPGQPVAWVHDGVLGSSEHINFKDMFCLKRDGYINHPRLDRILEVVNSYKASARDKDRQNERVVAERKSREADAKAKKDDEAFESFKSDVEKIGTARVTSAPVGKPTVLGVH